MRSSLLLLVGAVSLAACGESPTITGPRSPALGTPAFDAAGGAASGAVFTQTNAAAGNAVVIRAGR